MKKAYWLIIVFVVWCVASAIWYLVSIRGISTDPEHFNKTSSLVAIIEILLMVLGAFLIGFGTSWLLKDDAQQTLMATNQENELKMQSLRGMIEATRSDQEKTMHKMQQAEEKLGALMVEKKNFTKQLEEANKIIHLWQRQSKEADAKAKQLEGEATSLKFRIRLLENDLAEKEEQLAKQKEELVTGTQQTAQRDWSDHPFVRPVENANGEIEKDELTLIKGIGPKFMQKLYSLDIYSFRQLSELSGEEVERLAEVIEVFPDRIHRDNWIGQATKLYLKKTNKE